MTEKRIIYELRERWKYLYGFLLLCLTILALSYFSEFNFVSSILLVVISFLGFLFPAQNGSYIVFADRIEIYHATNNKLKQSLKNEEIDQVRYEDSFGYYFIVYPKNEVIRNRKTKKQYLMSLPVLKTNQSLIVILKHFKDEGIDVKIKTRSKKILIETGLENWDKT